MIKICFSLMDNQQIKRVVITGHAGYADSGEDIVCAAVSSQAISVENSLDQILQIPMDIEINDQQGGYLSLTLPEIDQKHKMEQAQLLLRHLNLAFEVLAENYPEYIKINYDKFQP